MNSAATLDSPEHQPSAVETRRIALIGNPNVGKTTVFNVLTGFRARVGNYPGVTVERHSGPLKGTGGAIELVDLPGTYSLAARAPDEAVAADLLLGSMAGEERVDLVLVVVDASNLERNLYLLTQIMETGLPCLLVLNMMDSAKSAGLRLDPVLLSERLGVPVYPCIASRGDGMDALRTALAGKIPDPPTSFPIFPEPAEAAFRELESLLPTTPVSSPPERRFLSQRALLDVSGVAEDRYREVAGADAGKKLDDARQRLAEAGLRVETLEARTRYGWIRERLAGVLEKPTGPQRSSRSDRMDQILVHPVWGLAIFLLLMLLVFQAIYSWSGPLMDLIESGFGAIAGLVEGSMSEGPLRSLLVDGVIAGVGGVLVFLPQIMILFLFIGLLEDCGYMARAAFLMDRLLRFCGLSGRSFVPMLGSFACAIPGIMATRSIEDRSDRMVTILVAPLMSCSARLPVYVLFIGALVPDQKLPGGFLNLQGVVLLLMYLVGVVVAIPVAWLLRKTWFRSGNGGFVMEMPAYQRPNVLTVLHRVKERAMAFVKRAGTVIFAVSVVVWAATYFPRPDALVSDLQSRHDAEVAGARGALDAWLQADPSARTEDLLAPYLVEEPAEIPADIEEGVRLAEQATAAQDEADARVRGELLRQSYLGRLGRTIEPAVKPLGWDWRIAMAALASFPAREVIVSTLGIIFETPGDADENSVDLKAKLLSATNSEGSPLFTLPVGFSIMVFFALCAQCAATLAVIRRETNSWRWPIFAFAYMTGLAYVAALATYQVASRLLGGG